MLRDLTYQKKIAHMIIKQTPTKINYNAFSRLRAKCKSRLILDYNNYIFKTQNSLTTNPKLFWKFLNKKKHAQPYQTLCLIIIVNYQVVKILYVVSLVTFPVCVIMI